MCLRKSARARDVRTFAGEKGKKVNNFEPKIIVWKTNFRKQLHDTLYIKILFLPLSVFKFNAAEPRREGENAARGTALPTRSFPPSHASVSRLSHEGNK